MAEQFEDLGHPIGEVKVEFYRPMMTFDHGVRIYSQSGGETRYATVTPMGRLKWQKYDPRIDVGPALLVGDDVLLAMQDAVAGYPVQARGRAVHDHLADAIQVRDRLLAMTESAHAAWTNAPVLVPDMRPSQGHPPPERS